MNPSKSHLFALLCCAIISQISGHGYMSDPPGRSAAWRYGFDTAPNFNDNQVTCGRVEVEKCGVCGDPLSQNPGDNMLGGKYGSGTIVKTYKMGQVIRTKSKITANHAGWFEFALCEIKNNQPATEACLRPLVSTSVERRPKYAERPETKWELFMADGLGEFDVDIQLPAGFTCDHCVLRWLWNCGNDYACDSSGKCAIGLGPKQEKFYSCADIAITETGASKPTKKPTTTKTTTTTRTTQTRWTPTTTTTTKWTPTTTRRKTTTTTQRTTSTRNPTTTTTTTRPRTTTRVRTTTRKPWTTTRSRPVTTTRFQATTGRVTTFNGFTTTPPNKQTVCEGAKHGTMMADPDNCCGFVFCMWPGTRWETEKKMPCAAGTAWREETKYCDHAANVDCGARKAECLLS